MSNLTHITANYLFVDYASKEHVLFLKVPPPFDELLLITSTINWDEPCVVLSSIILLYVAK